MDRFMHSKIEEETIYEIYRACRLCGAGAGYKMPIIQNVVDFDDVPLTQKIRECVQIEVHQDDKMPPLICELCVDKVNDFYEFSEMCKQTNRRTRLRLGLPPQMFSRGTPNAGDCILGVTEPVYVVDDSNESVTKNRQAKQRNKSKKEPASNLKIKPSENRRNSQARIPSLEDNRRSTRGSVTSPTNILTLRNKTNKDTKSTEQSKKRGLEPLKSILKKEKNFKEEDLVSSRSKRGRDKEKPDVPVKRVKIEIGTFKSTTSRFPRSKSRAKSPEPSFVCQVCGRGFDTKMSLNSHTRIHSNEKNSKTKKSTSSRPTRVPRDIERSQSKVKSEHNLKFQRDKSRCGNCGKRCSSWINLKRHESSCYKKKKMSIDPKLLSQVRPLQIRVARCDPLLRDEYSSNVSKITQIYGLDKSCTYPYISKNIKIEPDTGRDGMVRIEDGIREVFDDTDYVHWDSDSDVSDVESSKKIASLFTLSLKTIFSSRYLGRVRKRRRVKIEEIQGIEKNNDLFDVIERFDDVHDLETINDSSYDQLFDDRRLIEEENHKECEKEKDDRISDRSNDAGTIVLKERDNDVKDTSAIETENAPTSRINEDTNDDLIHTDKEINMNDSVINKENASKENHIEDNIQTECEGNTGDDSTNENIVRNVNDTDKSSDLYSLKEINETILNEELDNKQNTDNSEDNEETVKLRNAIEPKTDPVKEIYETTLNEELDNIQNTDNSEDNEETVKLRNAIEPKTDSVKEINETTLNEENSNETRAEIQNIKNSFDENELRQEDSLANREEWSKNGELITENDLLGEVSKDSELSRDSIDYKFTEFDEKTNKTKHVNNFNTDLRNNIINESDHLKDETNTIVSSDICARIKSNEKIEMNETTSNINEQVHNSFTEDVKLNQINEKMEINETTLNVNEQDGKDSFTKDVKFNEIDEKTEINETTSNVNEQEDNSFTEVKPNEDFPKTNANEAEDIMRAVLNRVQDTTDYKNNTNGPNCKMDDEIELDDQRLMDEIDEQIGEELIPKEINLDDFSEDF